MIITKISQFIHSIITNSNIKNVIIKTYTLEEAEQEARCRIEDAFNDQKSSDLEKIVAMAATKQEETEDSYVFTYIVKKYESIGVFQEYEE